MGTDDEGMNNAPSPRVTKYVLIPLPRTDAKPRRFRLAPVDNAVGMPTLMAGPERTRRAG